MMINQDWGSDCKMGTYCYESGVYPAANHDVVVLSSVFDVTSAKSIINYYEPLLTSSLKLTSGPVATCLLPTYHNRH